MNHEREGRKILAMGYAGKGTSRVNRDGLNNLPGTEKEIMAIKEVMKNHVNLYYTEEGTTETNFKSQAKDFDVVHLAVHGQSDTLNAINSKLIFRTDKDSTEDGQLYAHELYTLDLSHLDLAVLSACESGIGKQQKGEGVMSIARGFAYAGCPSLVISLWKIDDRTTAQLMNKFYKYVSEGNALDISIANAKLDYIRGANEFNSHPFYWAAFLQVGNSEKLDIKKPNWWGWALAAIGLLLTVVAIYRLTSIARSNDSPLARKPS
jgi:CHAT domain-containing protein